MSHHRQDVYDWVDTKEEGKMFRRFVEAYESYVPPVLLEERYGRFYRYFLEKMTKESKATRKANINLTKDRDTGKAAGPAPVYNYWPRARGA